MQREEIVDLNAFMVIAMEKSFTRASARLGTSQSALSHVMKRLEARVGVRLLNRTTRSVSTTDAGRQLLDTLQTSFDNIGSVLNCISNLREQPSGSIRISAPAHATDIYLWPKLSVFLRQYPLVKVEIDVNQTASDVIKDGFDAGVRLGHEIAKDMIAVRISPDIKKVYIASPAYMRGRKKLNDPREVLTHRCITYRRPITKRILPWDFCMAGVDLQLRVEGELTFSSDHSMIDAALDGHGIACVVEDRVRDFIQAGQLIDILPDCGPKLTGFHLYYPSRRQNSAAFGMLVKFLRHSDA